MLKRNWIEKMRGYKSDKMKSWIDYTGNDILLTNLLNFIFRRNLSGEENGVKLWIKDWLRNTRGYLQNKKNVGVIKEDKHFLIFTGTLKRVQMWN